MKNLYLSFCILLCLNTSRSIGQDYIVPVDSNTGEIKYQEIVEVPKKNKDQLFADATLWLSDTFKDYKAVIEIEDKANGRLVAKGLSDLTSSQFDKKKMTFRVAIDCRDEKYRVMFDNISSQWSMLGGSYHDFPVSPLTEEELNYSSPSEEGKKKKSKRDSKDNIIQDKKKELTVVNNTIKSLLNSLKAKMVYVDDF